MSDRHFIKRHPIPFTTRVDGDATTMLKETGLTGKILALQSELQHLYFLYQEEKNAGIEVPFSLSADFETRFFEIIHRINLLLLEEKDNFYGYFFIQMDQRIRFDIASPSGVQYKGATYVIYFNPFLFLELSPEQMKSAIKHEILHIVSLHLMRARSFRTRYRGLALNLAMDIVVNMYIHPLPLDAVDLGTVNRKYGLQMKPFKTFEYYAEEIENALSSLVESEFQEGASDEQQVKQERMPVQLAFDVAHTHDLWDESDKVEDRTLQEITKQYVKEAKKGELSSYLATIVEHIENAKDALPWHYYLKKLVGTITSGYKKTTTRRNRRQPNRMELRGRLRKHKATIYVAIDISGSISDSAFYQAMKEVFNIIKCDEHDLVIVECDHEIRRSYSVATVNDVKDRPDARGGTAYSPVISYANQSNIDLLIYFTDGKGEKKLKETPKGYRILWIISGGERLSLTNPYGIVKPLQDREEVEQEDIYIRVDGFSMNHQERTIYE